MVGSIVYGVGICWRQDLELQYQQEEAGGSMDDEKMINMLKGAGPSSDFPLALAEIVHVSKEEFIVRRLHLISPECCWMQPRQLSHYHPPQQGLSELARQREGFGWAHGTTTDRSGLIAVKTTHERCGPFSLCRLEPNVSHKVCS